MSGEAGRSAQLIPAAELAERPDDIVLLDARAGEAGRKAYADEHLVGARHADLDRDLAAPVPDPARGGRHPLPEISAWCQTLGAWGITSDTDIVVYDDQGGALAAARAWWLLRAVGHDRVALLDGGWQAARAVGLPTEATTRVHAAEPYPVPGREWALATVDIQEVDALRLQEKHLLVDVRSVPRFRGDIEPLDPVAGHIPGAVNVAYSANLAESGCFHDEAALRAIYEPLVEGAETVDVYCGSGVTACHTLFALARAGIDDTRLYVGSWGEWCRTALARASVT